MGKNVKCWWSRGPKPGNLGDVLTPVILRGLGIEVRWSGLRSADLIATGSIVRFARAGQLVWGSGVMWAKDRPDPRARYLAVRGPLTRDAVLRNGGHSPEVYGDPALLLPRVHRTPVDPVHDVGLVPHYVDLGRPAVKASGLPVISPLSATPLAVVDRIRSCRAVLSSSLHGIIAAHAYGIPAAWVRLGDGLDGDDSKFRDYAASVGVELVPHRRIEDAEPVLPTLPDLDRLVEALP